MSHYHSYLNSAKEILLTYKGDEPFASFAKKYFSLHKKFGSKDRKHVAHLCYCYFRLGKALPDLAIEERISAGLFFCSNETNEILEHLKPEWNEKVNLPLQEKLSSIHYHLSSENIFPWTDELSDSIDKEQFIFSHWQQPDLFLRLRPGKEEMVKQKLQNACIEFSMITENCLALSNASKIDKVIEFNKEAVVQDHSSQKVGELFKSAIQHLPSVIRVWDCCAGSGGKSIMLYDINPKIELTVSDIRETILINLKKRFTEAGIKKYKSFVTDLTSNELPIAIGTPFDLIICDAPCTGSGAWGRTPEQLFYFKKEKINEYVLLQKKIVSSIIPHLKPGGHLLYITCSVFKKENEEMAEFIKKQFHLDIVKTELLKGYDKNADTMFVALLKKPL